MGAQSLNHWSQVPILTILNVQFSGSTLLSSHHHHLPPALFHHLKLNSARLTLIPHFLLPWPRVTTSLLSVSGSDYFKTSYKWNNTVFVLSYLASFTVFKVHTCYRGVKISFSLSLSISLFFFFWSHCNIGIEPTPPALETES